MFKVVFGFLILIGFAHSAAAACEIPVREKSYERYYLGTYYDVLNVPKSSLADLSTSRQYNYSAHFKKKVQEQTKTDPNKDLSGSSPLLEKVLTKKIGRTRKISCLENFLLDNHLRTFSAATGFAAYVLTKFDSEDALVVAYTPTGDLDAAETAVAKLVENYRKQGWNVESQIRVRPFLSANASGDITGTLRPNKFDIDHYRNLSPTLRLRSAIITNGFDSLVLYASDFNRL